MKRPIGSLLVCLKRDVGTEIEVLLRTLYGSFERLEEIFYSLKISVGSSVCSVSVEDDVLSVI